LKEKDIKVPINEWEGPLKNIYNSSNDLNRRIHYLKSKKFLEEIVTLHNDYVLNCEKISTPFIKEITANLDKKVKTYLKQTIKKVINQEYKEYILLDSNNSIKI